MKSFTENLKNGTFDDSTKNGETIVQFTVRAANISPNTGLSLGWEIYGDIDPLSRRSYYHEISDISNCYNDDFYYNSVDAGVTPPSVDGPIGFTLSDLDIQISPKSRLVE